ncbi:MAG: DUF512 domain-containing protein [Clostridia bacterium]|nr:DUF512 domain-containing protein [Clostridia bacterium]
MAHEIIAVQPHGVAYRRGLRPGDALIAINGEPILDEIDYQALINHPKLDILVCRADGREETVRIIKAKEAGLGLQLADTLACTPRQCKNKCVFCFIDQMPPGMRKTLYVKDDDWRLSLMMGNYITLTNVDEQEFQRILKRKASPLYISIHATDPDVRVKMMRNPNARFIMDRLHRLADARLHFHCQIVLCPGYNDGDVLKKTLNDLAAMYPAAQSAALVPVGLTKFRQRLAHVEPFDQTGAKKVLEYARSFQQKMLGTIGTRFVFPSDEMVLIAGEELPSEDEYEGFPQLENGVGLLRKFENALAAAAREDHGPVHPRRVLIPCGKSIAPVMRRWVDTYGPKEVDVTVQPIRNTFFGETVTVTGLITGGDLKEQLKDADVDEILLCGNTLRAEGDLFLDDMPLSDLRAALKPPITLVPNDGASLIQALYGADSIKGGQA